MREFDLPRPNYQREKRLKDIARQQKQEEKRNRRFRKEDGSELDPDAVGPGEGDPEAATGPAGDTPAEG